MILRGDGLRPEERCELDRFVIVCAGVWVMRVKNPDQARPFKTPWVPVVPILGIAVNFALMYSLGWSNWLRLIIWLVIGQAIYFGYGRRHSHLRVDSPAVARRRAGD